MPEPFASLAAFLSDIYEQVVILERDHVGDPFAVETLEVLKDQIVKLALMVMVKGGGVPPG